MLGTRPHLLNAHSIPFKEIQISSLREQLHLGASPPLLLEQMNYIEHRTFSNNSYSLQIASVRCTTIIRSNQTRVCRHFLCLCWTSDSHKILLPLHTGARYFFYFFLASSQNKRRSLQHDTRFRGGKDKETTHRSTSSGKNHTAALHTHLIS